MRAGAGNGLEALAPRLTRGEAASLTHEVQTLEQAAWYKQAVALIATAPSDHTWRGHVLNNTASEAMLTLLLGLHQGPAQQTKQSLETALRLWLHPQLLLSCVVVGAVTAATLAAATTHKVSAGI